MNSNILKLLSKIPKGANPVLDAIGIIPTAQSVFNPKDNIITALQNFGTSVENQFAAPGQERRYVGSSPAAVAANRRLDARNVGDITGRYIPGSQQYPFISGSPSPVNLPPADTFGATESPAARRAYQEEKARVAQLTEQDPLFKKYKIGELTKAYNEAKGDERERIGLQIWATTNPELAGRLRPGQVGYQTSAALKGSQVFGTDVPGTTETMYQQASQAAGLPSNISFTASDPRFSNAFGTGLNAEQLGVSAPGTMPPSMIGADLFKRDFDIPSSKDLTQTQLAFLKREAESRIK